MRGLKSTLALAVVLAGLGAYIYFVASKEDPNAGGLKKVFAGLETDAIDEITIRAESGEVTTAKKTAGAWQLISPTPGNASESEVTGITSALGSVDISRVLEEEPASLKDYGLDAPRIEVEFKSTDGKAAGRLLLGAKTTAGGNLYAKRGDQKRVLVIGGFHEGSFNKSTFDLRDKALMAFDRSAVTSVDVTAGGTLVQLDKLPGDETAWRVVKPLASRADGSAAEGILGRIETAQMKSVVANEASPADLKKYGLDKPAVTVTLKLGSAQATLAVGGKAGEEDVYVRDISKPIIMTVEKGLAEDLAKTAEDYRLKELFEFRAYTATRMEFTRSGKPTVAFERVKGTDGAADTWKRVSPTAADAEKDKIETLLTGLADIRAQSFTASLANTGLSSPVLTVVAKFDEGKKEERVTFGKSGADVYAATVDPGASKIEASRLDEALKTLDELSK